MSDLAWLAVLAVILAATVFAVVWLSCEYMRIDTDMKAQQEFRAWLEEETDRRL